MEIKCKIGKKSPIIRINDIFDDLSHENNKLKNELLFAKKYINILTKFKTYLDQNCHKFECFDNCNNSELKAIYFEFNRFVINEKTFPNIRLTIDRNSSFGSNDNSIGFEQFDFKVTQTDENKTHFKTSDDLNNELNKNEKQTEYKCDIPDCHYIAFRPKLLLDHKNSHFGLRPYKCTQNDCNKTFSMFRNMRSHQRLCHNDNKPVKCEWPECGAQMTSKSRLKTHMRKHTGEKPFVCEWTNCDYKTTQSVNLQHHMNSKHTKQRPYKCTFKGCNADFVYPGSLHTHIIGVHTERKKFECDWPGCEARHKHYKSYYAHKLSHEDIKPFKCDWPACDYSTRRPELLRNHKFVHTGERNYLCSWPACDKRFKTQKALKEHLMIHKDDKRYACKWPGCEYRCVSSGNIYKHYNVHHKKLK